MNATMRQQLDKLFGTCQWCDVYHPRGQCAKPRNASKSSPGRSATAVFQANVAWGTANYTERPERPKRITLADLKRMAAERKS